MFSELDGFNQQKIKLLARDQQLTKLTVYIYIYSSPKNWESGIKMMPGARPIKQHVSLHDFMWCWLMVTTMVNFPARFSTIIAVSPARAIWPRLISTNRMSTVSPREKMLGSSTCLSFSLTCVALVSIDVHSHRMHQMESSPEGPLQNKLPPASNVRKSPSISKSVLDQYGSHYVTFLRFLQSLLILLHTFAMLWSLFKKHQTVP